MDLLTLPGVFTPRSDSWQLAEAVRREGLGHGTAVLDLCTGSGVVALAAAACGADVTAVDASWRAVATVRMNAFRHGLGVRVRRGRSYEPVSGRRFDLIVANPPYVPSTDDVLPTSGPSRAWAAGRDGRRVLDEICDGARDHLRPGGALMVVHSALIGEDATLAKMRSTGLVDARVLERHRGPLGPLMRAQQDAGNLPRDLEEEDVIIARATAPCSSSR